MLHKPHRKPVPPPIPDPHRLLPGQTITLSGAPATITAVANMGGYYRVGVQIDGWTTHLFVRTDGNIMPQAPLQADRLILSGALK